MSGNVLTAKASPDGTDTPPPTKGQNRYVAFPVSVKGPLCQQCLLHTYHVDVEGDIQQSERWFQSHEIVQLCL